MTTHNLSNTGNTTRTLLEIIIRVPKDDTDSGK